MKNLLFLNLIKLNSIYHETEFEYTRLCRKNRFKEVEILFVKQ
jgi:hypothetical protein